jgi:hypothetical protein
MENDECVEKIRRCNLALIEQFEVEGKIVRDTVFPQGSVRVSDQRNSTLATFNCLHVYMTIAVFLVVCRNAAATLIDFHLLVGLTHDERQSDGFVASGGD